MSTGAVQCSHKTAELGHVKKDRAPGWNEFSVLSDFSHSKFERRSTTSNRQQQSQFETDSDAPYSIGVDSRCWRFCPCRLVHALHVLLNGSPGGELGARAKAGDIPAQGWDAAHRWNALDSHLAEPPVAQGANVRTTR